MIRIRGPRRTATVAVVFALAVLAAAACNNGHKPSSVSGPGPTPPAADAPVSPTPPATAPGATMQTVAFKPLGQEDRIPAVLAGLELSLSIEPEQAAGDGLAFTVSAYNQSPSAITLHNPYDVLSYQLGNGEGWPIAQRAPGSRIKAGRHVDRTGYLRVRGIRVDGQPVADVSKELQASALAVQAGSTYAWDLTIDKVVAPENKPDAPTSIVPGEYKLSALIALVALVPSDPPGATIATGVIPVVVK